MLNLKITDVRANPGDSAFLIDDGKTAILCDSGFAFTGYAVADNIKKELGARKLDFIFLTHSHYDHALGSAYVSEYWPEAKVVASEYAAAIFQKPTAKRVMQELDRKFAAKCGIFEYPDRIDHLKVDIPVKDGDVIQAGDMRFTVLALPGHTKCSVGFYCSEKKFLLSSETLGVFDGEKSVVPSYLVGYQMTLDSIEKAEKLVIDYILIPHVGLLNKETSTFYLQNAKKATVETCNEIVDILRSGGSKADAVKFFKDKFYHGNLKNIYPQDAMELNTNIMVDLIAKEFEI